MGGRDAESVSRMGAAALLLQHLPEVGAPPPQLRLRRLGPERVPEAAATRGALHPAHHGSRKDLVRLSRGSITFCPQPHPAVQLERRLGDLHAPAPPGRMQAGPDRSKRVAEVIYDLQEQL